MHTKTISLPKTDRGFSVAELMIVLAILIVMSAAIFEVVISSLTHSSVEQARLDIFQEAREFMDQMSRDLHEAGYPSPRNVAANGVLTANPVTNDTHAAVGIVKVDGGDLWFEGDVDGTGIVSVVRYHLDTSTTNNCPCLRRSQQPKITGDPMSGQTTPVYQTEVQGVQNTNIFSAFTNGSAGTPVTLPVDFTSNGTTIADIDTVQAVLTVESPYTDPRTQKKPSATLISTVRLNNCSQAAPGLAMSCQ
jgi:type II secretory pathway pseudopilin PulG